MTDTRTLAETVLDLCRRRGWKLATAESCTGGMIAAALTDIAGSSDVVERGFVTYSNEAKSDLLGVPAALIAQYGAVSEPVAHGRQLAVAEVFVHGEEIFEILGSIPQLINNVRQDVVLIVAIKFFLSGQ